MLMAALANWRAIDGACRGHSEVHETARARHPLTALQPQASTRLQAASESGLAPLGPTSGYEKARRVSS